MIRTKSAIATLLASTLLTTMFLFANPACAAMGDCGQPISDGPQPVATDALFVLGVAIGVGACDPCVCDVDGNFSVSATDALLLLTRAVGQSVQFFCPSCESSCEGSAAPECGGTCHDGEICSTDPFEPTRCECLNACEASDAPTCGGSCDEEDPEIVCTAIGVDTGEGFDDACACLPAEASTCEDAETPDCSGICTPGHYCTQDNGSCVCEAQPIQGGCGQASPPACGGTCPDGFICQDIADGCACVQTGGGDDSCYDADGPTCAGSCSGGEACVVGFFGECECFEPCELSDAPTCGGSCNDDSEICQRRGVMVGGSTVEFCECVEAQSLVR